MALHSQTVSDSRAILHRRFRPAAPPAAPHRSTWAQGLVDALLILAFFTAIAAPLAGYLLGWKTSQGLEEKRELAPFPDLRQNPLVEVPAKLDKYWQDHFGFRASLIRAHNNIKHQFLGVSNADVVVGRQGWLYFAGAGMVDDYLGVAPFAPEALARWSDELTWRHRWLAEQGIRYLFVIAPNKSTVYSEYLPPALLNHAGITRSAQLQQHLRAHCPASVLDLTDALSREKGRADLYFSNDSHWNGHGLLVAHRAVWDCLRGQVPGLASNPADDWRIVASRQYGYRDLAMLLGLSVSGPTPGDFLAPTQAPALRGEKIVLPPECSSFRSRGWDDPLAFENPKGKGRLLFFGDSFWRAGAVDRGQPIAGGFAHSAMIVLYPTRREFVALVKQQRPDVVVEERAERSLLALPIDDSAASGGPDAGRAKIKSITGVFRPDFLFDGICSPDKFATAHHREPIVIEFQQPHRYRAICLHLYDFDGRYYKFLVEGQAAGSWRPLLDATREGRSGKVDIPLPPEPLAAIRITSFYNSDERVRPTNKVLHLTELELLDK